ncbi:hypothetical protein [Asticcacaulis sp. AC402]|uniref:hypothetical protein n=1 Tax=Asticcacaulis sp. AC402 TaxID=1282361 RepID=UPI0003C3E6F8|nr:hypothetical protein [Asticcacaulis sp. AC402]ESQ74643.1 hypothetical protein ABAC402_13440 [Asticcacaulis sp. AC402]
MKKFLAAAVLFAAFAGSVHAQDAAPPAEDGLTTEDVLTVSIGCIATYDTLIAQGKAGARAAEIQKARAFAVSVYKEFSGETDEEVASDIAMADQAFPEMLKDSTITVESFQETCDAIFFDEPEAAAPAA